MRPRLRIGVMGCSGFARRTMVPALLRSQAGDLAAVASRSAEKASTWARELGCPGLAGYDRLLEREDIDVVYLPLPAALNEEWAPKALAAGKHLLVEKSFATRLEAARRIVEQARARNLLIRENFHFSGHSQWARLRSFMDSGEIGEVHLVRSTFGFPPLPRDNFRWQAELGGGALLDAGAYVAKVSQLLLGAGLEIRGAALQMDAETGVDRYGEAMFRNGRGQVAQVAFGFDYFYQCGVELLGTRGKVSSGRVFTAKPEDIPRLRIEIPGDSREERLPPDDAYANMWRNFAETVAGGDYREEWDLLLDQARLLEGVRQAAARKGMA